MSSSINDISQRHVIYGLVGKSLGHSFSRTYFSQKFKEEGLEHFLYLNFELEHIAEIMDLLETHTRLRGFNVTIPYKETIMDYLDEISENALHVGAVNTVVVDRNRMLGFNTDVVGFERTLVKSGLHRPGQSVLLFGTGGAARAVIHVLEKFRSQVLVVSRAYGKGDLTYPEVTEDILGQCDLIINATPIGMFPDVDAAPQIPYHTLHEGQVLIDLIYNPEKTLFLERGERRGCRIINGLSMLHVQADKSWEIWKTYL